MTRAPACSRCLRCGAELQATGRLAERAHAAGLCSDCWLDVPTPANEPMACSRCLHSAASHMHGDPLAPGPLAHGKCSVYTPRTSPAYGAWCNIPGCECGGYCPREEG